MAPSERRMGCQRAQLTKQSLSLDTEETGDLGDSSRTIGDSTMRDRFNTAPAWLKKSKETLGETPQYLIRTGSLKSRRIKEPGVEDIQPCMRDKDQGTTCYVVQTGCYMYTGRTFHKDSYIVQRKERQRRKDSSSQNWKPEEEVKSNHNPLMTSTTKQGTSAQSETANDSCHSNSEKRSRNAVNRTSNKVDLEFQSFPESLNNDDIVIPGDKAQLYGKYRKSIYRKSEETDVINHVNGLSMLGNGAHQAKTKYQKQISYREECDNKAELPIFTGEETTDVCSERSLKSDEICDKNMKTEAVAYVRPDNKQSAPPEKNTDPLSSALRSRRHSSKTISDVVRRMKEKLDSLVGQQLDVDQKVIANELIGKEIGQKLHHLASRQEVDKFWLHLSELDSVNFLMLGLAARLAKLEENMKKFQVHHERGLTSDDLFSLQRKKEKLIEQISEARWIKSSIDNRSKKVGRYIEKYLGGTGVVHYQSFIKEKERLSAEIKEVTDKVKLSRKQLAEVLQEEIPRRQENC